MPRRARKDEPEITRGQVPAFLIMLLVPGLLIYVWFGLAFGQVSTERVIDASGFVVQIDSFLTAGFFVGVFGYWGDLLKRMREVKFPFLPSLFSSSVLTSLIAPFAEFAISAFLAIGGILTGDSRYLEWALYLTSYALINVLALISGLHKNLGAVESVKSAEELQQGSLREQWPAMT